MSEGTKPITIDMLVKGKVITFEIDSGSSVSAISVEYWREYKEL